MPKDSVSSNNNVALNKTNLTPENQLIEKYLFINEVNNTQDKQANDNKSFLAHIKQQIKYELENPNNRTKNEKHLMITLNDCLIVQSNNKEYQLTQSKQHFIMLIDKLFDYLLHDSNLSRTIQLLINQLRIVYLVLLIQDKQYINTHNHPARHLLNDLIKIGLLWIPKEIAANQIIQQIEKITKQLKNNILENIPLSESFKNSAKRLNEFYQTLTKRAEIFEKRIKEAEEGKAKAEQAKNQAKKVLNKIMSKTPIPLFIQQMLEDVWQHVIFLEILKSNKIPLVSSLLIGQALLVSVQPIKQIDELAKFIELQPKLIEWLRKKFEKTAYSFAEIDAFFIELDNLHNKIISDAQLTLKSAPKEEILRLKPVETLFKNQHSKIEKDHKNEQNSQVLINEFSLEQWIKHQFDHIATNNTNRSPKKIIPHNKTRYQKDLAASEKIIQLLKPGCWLIIQREESKVHCKLASYIEASDKYILVNGSGNKIAEYNKSSLIKEYHNKNIEILESTALFEKAYQSTIEDLLTQFKQAEEKERLEKMEMLKEKKIQKERALKKEKEKEKKEKEKTKITQQNIKNISCLTVGSWVEIKISNKIKKCRLAAKIASSGKFIFTDRSGIKIKECLADELATLYQSGQLQLEQENDLFDEALASVISNLRNLKSDKN